MVGLQQLTSGAGGFMAATGDYGAARAVLFGAPMDFTVSFRPGTRLGPQKIREVSSGLEEYSPQLDRELGEVPFYDAGDLVLPLGNVAACLQLIRQAAALIVDDGKIPLLLGGEHLVSLPAISAVHARHPDLAVVHFDAHADLRSDYAGEANSHATVMRRVLEVVGADNLYQFGVRSGTRAEFAYAREHIHSFPFAVTEALPAVLPELSGRPVYVSLDIDVVDPAFAPGTGTPEPGGCTSREILAAIHLLGQLDIVGFDLVEVAPVYDQSERTSLLAAKILRELILSFR
jgi:agmatinase